MTKGELIRELRKYRNLTQKELGNRCKIAETTIRSYELGRLNPKYETLDKITTGLDVNIDDFLFFLAAQKDMEEIKEILIFQDDFKKRNDVTGAYPSAEEVISLIYNGFTTGNKIRLVRTQRGLTQKELGDRCDIDELIIKKYELGEQNPRLDALEKIAYALEIDPAYFGTFWKTADFSTFDKTKSDEEKKAAFQNLSFDLLQNMTDWVESALLWVKKRNALLRFDVPKIANNISEFTDKEFDVEYYHIIQELIFCFENLNTDGQRKLFSRLSELLEMPKYTEKEE